MAKKCAPMAAMRNKRKALGLKQEELAKMVGVGQNDISRYEIGESFPKRDTLKRLAAALGCTVDELI